MNKSPRIYHILLTENVYSFYLNMSTDEFEDYMLNYLIYHTEHTNCNFHYNSYNLLRIKNIYLLTCFFLKSNF